MKTYEKSHKLDHVCYDIRGPIMDEANRMIRAGEDVMKLNIGNPAHFGFKTPKPLLKAMAENLPNTEGYTDSHGLMSARRAIVDYCKEKGIPNVGVDDVFTGNGVSELITLSMQGLLDNGDEVHDLSCHCHLLHDCIHICHRSYFQLICQAVIVQTCSARQNLNTLRF